nr:thioredoxin-like domain-containing protein [Chryseolinea sp.]
DTYAIIKTEEIKTYAKNTIRTTAFYGMYTGQYYPYHFILEGESHASDSSSHAFHIELMSVEIKKDSENMFTGSLPGREELLNIPYDSVFWTTNTTLKTTPLEDDIIRDLGGGISLNRQFLRYKQYETNVSDGGNNGEEKFNWFKDDSKGNRILYLVFWSDNFQKYLIDLELVKQLNQKYRNKITFVFLSLDDDQERWQQTVKRFSFYVDGIIQYHIGKHSAIAKSFLINDAPDFVLISRNGEVYDSHARKPSDPLLLEDFKFLLDNK